MDKLQKFTAALEVRWDQFKADVLNDFAASVREEKSFFDGVVEIPKPVGGIGLANAAPFSLWANGKAERYNQTEPHNGHDNIGGHEVERKSDSIVQMRAANIDGISVLITDWSNATLEDVPVDWMPEPNQIYFCNGKSWINTGGAGMAYLKEKFGRFFPTERLAKMYLESLRREVEKGAAFDEELHASAETFINRGKEAHGIEELLSTLDDLLKEALDAGKISIPNLVEIRSKAFKKPKEVRERIEYLRALLNKPSDRSPDAWKNADYNTIRDNQLPIPNS